MYPIFLVYGYLLFADDRFGEVMERKGKTALSLVVLTFPLIIIAFKMMKMMKASSLVHQSMQDLCCFVPLTRGAGLSPSSDLA